MGRFVWLGVIGLGGVVFRCPIGGSCGRCPWCCQAAGGGGVVRLGVEVGGSAVVSLSLTPSPVSAGWRVCVPGAVGALACRVGFFWEGGVVCSPLCPP